MTKAQQTLKEDIEKIKDDTTIEKVRIFVMGILTQQSIFENQRNPTNINFYGTDEKSIKKGR